LIDKQVLSIGILDW